MNWEPYDVCPRCSSTKVERLVDTTMTVETTPTGCYAINRTCKRCLNCDHVWDRKAKRGDRIATPQPKQLSLWARLLNAIFNEE
jgi:hypothetical protein